MNDMSIKPKVEAPASDPWSRMMNDLINSGPTPVRDGRLNDDEIDRLMGLPQSGDRRSGKEAIADPSSINSGFSPAMRLVAETFVDMLTRRMRQVVAGNIDITLIDLSFIRLSMGIGSLPLPSLVAVLHSRALSGLGIGVIDAGLAGAFFDILMGGGQSAARDLVTMRPYSAIELQLFRKLAETATSSFTEAFSELAKVDFAVDRVETNPRLVALGKPTDNAVRLRVQMMFGRRGGMLDLLFPFSLFASIEHLIRPKEDDASVADDGHWRHHLVQSVARSTMQLEAVLAEFRLPLRTVLSLEIGQTIPLDLDANTPISLQSNGNRLASGLMGRSRDHMALRLTGPIARPPHMKRDT